MAIDRIFISLKRKLAAIPRRISCNSNLSIGAAADDEAIGTDQIDSNLVMHCVPTTLSIQKNIEHTHFAVYIFMYAAVVIQKAFINRLYSLKVNEGEEANALAFISATAIQKPGPSCEVNTYHYCGIVENLENGF